MDTPQPALNRYHRQMLLPGIGPEGQRKLANARALLVGCGALGTVIADQLVRAGVGHLRLVDRDIVELTNLQRQTLFDESDVAHALPKAIAAANRLRQINSSVTIEPLVTDVHAGNIQDLCQLPPGNCQLILDGTDNLETRYLLNDVAVQGGIPWVYGGAVGYEGRVLGVFPGVSPCLLCLFPTPPAPAQLPTCDTAGVLGPLTSIVGSLQATLAIKILTGNAAVVPPELITLDLWSNRLYSISVKDGRREDCPCCAQRRFPFLNSPHALGATSLCGRNAVQIRSSTAQSLSLPTLAARLQSLGQVQSTPYFVRCTLHDPPNLSLTVFPDARVIVHGTDDPARARSIAARFVGA